MFFACRRQAGSTHGDALRLSVCPERQARRAGRKGQRHSLPVLGVWQWVTGSGMFIRDPEFFHLGSQSPDSRSNKKRREKNKLVDLHIPSYIAINFTKVNFIFFLTGAEKFYIQFTQNFLPFLVFSLYLSEVFG
jgi:hypothetical protein